MSMANVRAEIAKYYRNTLDGVEVSEHGGAFTAEDIRRYAKKAPAVIVACIGVPQIKFQGTVVAAFPTFEVFCLSSHTSSRQNRDTAAWLLAESVAVETVNNTWDGAADSTPKNLSAANRYSVPLDKLGVGLWSVRWEQQVDLDRNAVATLDDFLTMESTYDIGQTDDTVDTTDITELPQ